MPLITFPLQVLIIVDSSYSGDSNHYPGKKYQRREKFSKWVSHFHINEIPYRTKIRQIKLSKFRLCVENFVQRKILSVENFVQYFNTKIRQKLDKSVKISALCRKFCQTRFCPIRYMIGSLQRRACLT